MDYENCQLIRGRGDPNLYFHPLLGVFNTAFPKQDRRCFYVDLLTGQLFLLSEEISSEHPNGVWVELAEWPERVKRNYVQAYGPVPCRS